MIAEFLAIIITEIWKEQHSRYQSQIKEGAFGKIVLKMRIKKCEV
jgi:hypothetical protein